MTFITNASIIVSGTVGKGEYAFDLNDETSWKEEGKGASIEFNFAKTVNIDKIDIKFGGKQDQIYDIYYYATNEYHLFQQIQGKGGSGQQWQTFDVDKFVNITKVKLVGQNDINEIVDIRFLSEACNCTKPECECEPAPSPSPSPAPAPTPAPEPTPVPPPAPEDLGRVKDWGSKDDNPNNWKVTEMKDKEFKGLFKVVDKDDVNRADQFKTKKGAEDFIAKAIKDYKPEPQPTPTPTPNPQPEPTGDVDQFGVLKIYPDADSKKVFTGPEIEGKIRHYRSGKPSEPTCEATIDMKDKSIKNVEATSIIKMKGMQHVDTIDWKLRGGHHSSNNPDTGTCYIFAISTDGKWTKQSLRVERPHPSYHDAGDLTKPLFEINKDLSKTTIGFKGIAVNTPDDKAVHLECWVNLDPLDANGKVKNEGWQKYIDITDNGQLPEGLILDAIGSLATIRIDAIADEKKAVPDFLFYSVREIKNKS